MPESPSAPHRSGSGRRFRILIDFDNTISRGDVLDGIIAQFAEDDGWRRLEEAWEAGLLPTRDCLDGQLRSLRGSWDQFARHLETVDLDPGFSDLLALARRESIELLVVSDNFDLFLGHILRSRGLGHVPFRANHLELAGDRVVPSFPHHRPECRLCAHCKSTHFLPPHDDGRTVVYIGDGRSDLCPARRAGVVFAKDGLRRQLAREGVPHLSFGGLDEVAERLHQIIHEDHR